jgi:hypothetical protein
MSLKIILNKQEHMRQEIKINKIRQTKIEFSFSSPWTGGLASDGGTPDPGTSVFREKAA